ncbi:MAG: hypothetical protein OXB86_07440, partial [Bdellovibrionales bacterium]|nr:hypothetical protein [Bdellovibrionales bacterium]
MKKFGIVIIIILFFLVGCGDERKKGSDSGAKALTEAEHQQLSQALISAASIGDIQDRKSTR